ncbi:MAG: sigma-70 family RNA polymerase sigma factor [Pseudomonadota bacterium]
MSADRLFDHLEDLHVYALRLTRDRTEAEDLVQDTVAHVLARGVSLAEVDSPRAYLAAVLRNRWRDGLRRRSVTFTPLGDWDPADPAGAGFEELARSQTWAAVDRLPVRYRAALRLRVEMGLSYAEMARVLDIPVGTAMSRVARAREKLRAIL